jgi:hypothetical protein
VERTSGGKAAETVLGAVLRRLPGHEGAAARLRRCSRRRSHSRCPRRRGRWPRRPGRAAAGSAGGRAAGRMTVANRFRIDAQIGRAGWPRSSARGISSSTSRWRSRSSPVSSSPRACSRRPWRASGWS